MFYEVCLYEAKPDKADEINSAAKKTAKILIFLINARSFFFIIAYFYGFVY